MYKESMFEDHSFVDVDYKPSSLVEILRARALGQPDRLAYTFLVDGETKELNITYHELDRRARAIGARLQGSHASGERAVLVYLSGLDYIAAFFGCLYAGAIAVPVYPPKSDRSLDRMLPIVKDAQAKFVLTTTQILSLLEPALSQAPILAEMEFVDTDEIAGDLSDDWKEPVINSRSLAFLQYTSGSTERPKGVILSHENLMQNSALLTRAFDFTPESRIVSWLPMYHDMGLIGCILQPLHKGFPGILMSPIHFSQRPFRWLQAISRYRATVSGAPNFAYDLCVRKVEPAQIETLDLSSWLFAANAAEPINHETLQRFTKTFQPCGFRKEAFYPCYGLAEATLLVTGGKRTAPPIVMGFEEKGLAKNRVIEGNVGEKGVKNMVSCGRVLMDQKIAIVDPETMRRSSLDQVGEIWLRGPSVAQGYWGRPEETKHAFHAYLADTGEGPFLRTGDLGFLRDGELFVAGRLKDLIIIRGRKHYPQDIEATVKSSHPALQKGICAAFSVLNGEEVLVLEQELAYQQQPDLEGILDAILMAVAEKHELQIHAIMLIDPGTLPKTTSGKIQRYACRAEFVSGKLEVLTKFRGTIIFVRA